jgi:hypothetical protein
MPRTLVFGVFLGLMFYAGAILIEIHNYDKIIHVEKIK